ncbi:3-hydroxyacyl-ACP dehydratase [Capnocytophaga catalasegens]|uniref:3-hydroxyacyl-ACP dehydratase n=1 Tax=Capnocytophaga catalasegens TaxID=1004260 RepID=A0AAV5AVE7_9FLAO|nr:3-hydroxyacyl-ACP dehydratase [Capnocytophaga catalasegens]GIZ14347.1 3-hydroxyacyl-ACP dehydratase [Capnocytophaga catalasegens]GJM51344.1 3-hydroxyacyl-ACP dehydratase [Capnocytophaga catalasegens]GJM53239.1 3-hydroxyacyl-ACP dehydratase [Capnocytophaga catalasegens]
MLKDFYTIQKLEKQDTGKYHCQILLNKEHQIFEGHFPGNPITPGVCMMQIIKDITEEILGEKLFMSKTYNVKFVALINPEVTPLLDLSIDISQSDENTWIVKNVTSFADTIALKLTNIYQKVCL